MKSILRALPIALGIAGFWGLTANAATGKHIECHLEGSITPSPGIHEDTSHVLDFYLDDANAKIVAENSGLWAETVSYSDLSVEAKLHDSGLNAVPVAIFGQLAKESADFQISRITGQSVLGADLLRGVEIETGPCKDVAGPKAKF